MTEENKYLTTPELARKYPEKQLREILNYLKQRDLENTPPYVQFREILAYKLKN